MVVASKLFQEAVLPKNCNDLTHKGTCTVDALVNFYYFLLSNSRYFAPITLLPVLLKIRNWNKTLLFDTLKYYMECSIIGTFTGYSIKVFMCIFYHLFGAFLPLTFLFVPTIFGSFVLLFASIRVRRLYHTTIFQSMIETHLIRRKNCVTKTITNSKLLQMFIFMCCSTIILHAKRTGVYRGFWLLSPTAITRDNTTATATITTATTTTAPDTKEQHSGIKYVLVGMRNYMAIGLTLDTIKMLLNKIPNNTAAAAAAIERSNLHITWLAKLRTFRFNSTALLGSYVGIYRLVDHYGKHWLPEQQAELNQWLAGLLAGAAYIFLPKLTLLTFAMVQTIAILWSYYKLRPEVDYENNGSRFALIEKCLHQLQRQVKRLPYGALIYALSLAHLVHIYAMRPAYVGKLAETVINGVTDNYAYNISKKIAVTERHLNAAAAQATTTMATSISAIA